MNKWKLTEIEDILKQLDKQGLPFKKYAFSLKGEELQLLGEGGFAYVYEAEKRGTHRRNFAIKVIGFGNKHVEPAFFRSTVELQKELGQFQDDVVKVFAYAELFVWINDDNQVEKAELVKEAQTNTPKGRVLRLQFIVMEKLVPIIATDKSGKPYLIPDKLANFEEEELLKLAFDIGNALARAHEKKILHRDIKLENIFYSPDKKHYKLGDFGIAKVTDDGMASTMTFTKGYGAPEVITTLNDKYDNTADVYSFGMTLYIIANGLRFPDSENYYVNQSAQYQEGYRIPRPKYGTDELYRILEKMCRFDPDERQQSVKEVQNDLNSLLFNKTVQYKKRHNTATGVMGVIFWLTGIALWCLTFGVSWKVHHEWSFYALLFLGIGNAVLGILKKNTTNIGIVTMFFSIYYLVATGFTWPKLVFLFFLTFSPYNLVGVLSGTVLMIDFVELLLRNGVLVMYDMREYSWIPITLISFAAVLFEQYLMIDDKNIKLKKFIFGKNIFWILFCALYVVFILEGWTLKTGMTSTLHRILGANIIYMLSRIDLMKAGFSGLVLLAIWEVREKLLMKRKV